MSISFVYLYILENVLSKIKYIYRSKIFEDVTKKYLEKSVAKKNVLNMNL
jgi:metal-responsive CopG/Arc/MetJ family transcriptional regulator